MSEQHRSVHPDTSEFVLRVRCGADASFQVVKILDDMKIPHKLGEKRHLAPVLDQVLYDFIITIGSTAFVGLAVTLFKRLWLSKIHVEYETRYETARLYLKDRGPLVPLSRVDREDYSEYVFKTKDSNFKWTYDRGAITCRAEK